MGMPADTRPGCSQEIHRAKLARCRDGRKSSLDTHGRRMRPSPAALAAAQQAEQPAAGVPLITQLAPPFPLHPHLALACTLPTPIPLF